MTISASSLTAATQFSNASQNLASVQNKISTGKNVANALQNGAVFAIAQSISADISGLDAGDQNLNQTQGFLQVANAAATATSDAQIQAQGTIAELGSGVLSSQAQAALTQQLQGQAQQITNIQAGAVFNGINTFGGPATVATGNGGQTVTVNPSAQGTPSSAATTLNTIAANVTASGASAAQAALAPGGSAAQAVSTTGNTLNQIAVNNSTVQATQQFNQSINDAQQSGRGALVDTNLAQQATNLAQAQQQQQLSASNLGQINKSQSVVLTLFS